MYGHEQPCYYMSSTSQTGAFIESIIENPKLASSCPQMSPWLQQTAGEPTANFWKKSGSWYWKPLIKQKDSEFLIGFDRIKMVTANCFEYSTHCECCKNA